MVGAVSSPVSPEIIVPVALPEGVREGNENLVKLTPAAGGKVAALIAREAQGAFLRIAITGGGCNGLSYKMKFVPAPKRGTFWSGRPTRRSWSIPRPRSI